MDIHPKKPRLPSYWPLLIMPVLALAALYWKSYYDKFLYTGTWVGYNHWGKMALTFDSHGGCSWVNSTQSFSCSYRMQGNSARLILRSADTQLVGGKWRFVRNGAKAAGVPVVKAVASHKVIPLQNGAVLLVEADEAKYVDQKTGFVQPFEYQWKQQLQRVK